MISNKIYFSKVKSNAIIPTREKYNAGFDLYVCFDEDYIIIQPNETKLIPTGIASCIPEDYYIQIQERGSSGSRGIKYSAGVIDSSYRGEWFLATTNVNNKPIIITKLDIDKLNSPIKEIFEENFIIYPYSKALFQGIVHSVHNNLITEEIDFKTLQSIPSKRGNGKLGSSGK